MKSVRALVFVEGGPAPDVQPLSPIRFPGRADRRRTMASEAEHLPQAVPRPNRTPLRLQRPPETWHQKDQFGQHLEPAHIHPPPSWT